MKVEILHGVKGAQNAKGVAVIIDVFRASSRILACLHKKVKRSIPVETVEEAYALKRQHGSWILIGERNGNKIKGFDFGNSPATIMHSDVIDKTVILTTSSGTKGIIGTRNAEECIIASFSNISNVILYLREKNPLYLSLIPMGLNAKIPAIEDTKCAEIIKQRLCNEQVEANDYLSTIKDCPGMKRLQRLGQQDDNYYCLQHDIFSIIPVYEKKQQTIIQKG